MSYCDNCLHRKVCRLENVGDEEMTYCCDKLAGSNDVISRQAALEKAINVPIAKVVTEDKVICRKVIFADDIEKLPPATPQPKIRHCKDCKYFEYDSLVMVNGKWKREEFPNFTSYFCDKCGRGWRHKFNYCPNCGNEKEGEDDG